jgi:hypothetical protein
MCTVTLRTIWFKINKLYVFNSQICLHVRVPYGSHSKQRLFPQTALICWSVSVFPPITDCVCVFPVRYGLYLCVSCKVRIVSACFLQGTDCICVFPARYGLYLRVSCEVRAVPACFPQGSDCICVFPVRYGLYLCVPYGSHSNRFLKSMTDSQNYR